MTIEGGIPMNYISVSAAAKKWGLSERSVRNYCAEGRVSGAILVGKTWMIPENTEKPIRKTRSDAAPKTLLDILRREKNTALSGGIYHKVQIELTYNSNHIEGSRLTHRLVSTMTESWARRESAEQNSFLTRLMLQFS